MVDFSNQPTTLDQQRIEQVLSGFDLGNARLLHVGVGDSGLAARFHARCKSIDGITVSEQEMTHGQHLAFSNYRVFLLNKYHCDFPQTLRPGYDYIIDNNPSSFACCTFHYAQMLNHYRWALVPGGRILTDKLGMSWVCQDRRWRMSYKDLVKVGARFNLEPQRLTDDVYALCRKA